MQNIERVTKTLGTMRQPFQSLCVRQKVLEVSTGILPQRSKLKKKLVYEPVALRKLNNFLLSIFLIGARLIAGFTISHKVSKIAVSSFVSSVTHHTMNIIKNVYIKTYSP
jgi:hypothetical protein